MAYFESVMVKAYETLVDSDTTVDVNTGMIAAGRLQSLVDSRSAQPDIADMMVKTNRMISVVKSMLPESSWPELIRKLEGTADPAGALDDQSEAVDDDEAFDPLEFAEFDDDED